jgi:putative ABC transport system permease protein
LLLSLIGGVLGVAVAWWGLSALAGMPPPPAGLRIGAVALNTRVLLGTVALSVITGLVFGAAPALAAARLDLTGSLNESVGGTGTHATGHRTLGVLVSAQLAIALVLLIGTGLMIQSYLRLSGRELNLRPEGILSFELRLPGTDPSQSLQTMERVYDRLRRLPGAESVAGVWPRPVNSLLVPTQTIHIEGRRAPSTEAERNAASARSFLVTPDFFATVGAPLVRGREFGAGDTPAAAWGAIVNETAARRFWPGEDPIGKRFTLDGAPGERPRDVIGLVRDIPLRAAFFDVDAVVYTSFFQQSVESREAPVNSFRQVMFLLRHPADPMTLLPAARRVVAEIDPDRALASVAQLAWFTLFEVVNRGTSAAVLAIFAFTATLLAAVGIYGVMAYWIAQRTREIGIRMALGASAREVISLVGRRALLLIAVGLLAGLAGSLVFTRLIASQLWGITSTDPATFAAVSLLLAVVALLACFVPLRRAVQVDPTVALRYE